MVGDGSQILKVVDVNQIPADWNRATVQKLLSEGSLELVQDGNHGGNYPKPDEFADTGIPLITGADIERNVLNLRGCKFLKPESVEKLRVGFAQIGDVLLSHKGTMGKTIIIPILTTPYLVINPQLTLYRVSDKGRLDRRYLKYFFDSAQFQAFLARISAVSTISTLSLTVQKSIEICFPSKPEQRAIAHILGTLDDKIELNRRMNETLEAMARAIFKSWFVDFDPVRAKHALSMVEGAEGRPSASSGQAIPGLPKHIADLFPDRFEDSELGEIPAGWEIRSLYDCADYINGSAFRNEQFSSDRAGLPVIKIAELKDGITDQTKFTEVTLDTRYRITSGDILFSWSGSPDTSIDTFIWVGTDGWLNQHIFKILFKRPEEKYFVYYLLRHFKPEFIEIARNKQTTGLGHVTAQDLKRLKTVFPSDRALREFNLLAEPLFQKVYSNHCESRQLTGLRDTVLPKLISGELRVKNAESFLEPLP